jgi:type I restriction enzyme S subunit
LKSNRNYWQDGDILWISPKDITGPVIADSEDKITAIALANTRLRLYPSESVMVVVRSGILRHRFPVARCVKRFTVNQDLKVLTPNEDIDPQFIFCLLNHLGPTILRRVVKAGTTVESVDIRAFLGLDIPTPPPPEQRKIARILTTLDNLIEKTEALMAKYQAIKQGMMHDLFTRGVDAHGHLRPTPAEAPDLYKHSALGWIPKEWAVSCVADGFLLSTGFTLGLHRRPKRNVKRYLRVANVQRDEILLDDIAELEATDEEFETRRLETDDLLVVEGHADPGQIGRCAIVTRESAGLTFQNHLFRLRCRKVLPRFACDWLNSEIARRYWLCRCATSSGLNTINQTMLKKMPFLVPQPHEQEEIAARSVAHSASIKGMELALFKFRQINSGLMQDLLTGKVRVTVDELEEVADA